MNYNKIYESCLREDTIWLKDLEEEFAKFDFYRFYSDEETAAYRKSEADGRQIEVGFINDGPAGKDVIKVLAINTATMPSILVNHPKSIDEIIDTIGEYLRGE